jgi:hypothetical protein
VEYDSRGQGCDTRCPETVERAHWRAVSHGNGYARFGGGPGEQAEISDLACGLPYLGPRSRCQPRLTPGVRRWRSGLLETERDIR